MDTDMSVFDSSSTLSILVNDDIPPISPLISPSSSVRADDMSEVSISPYTPLLAMSPPFIAEPDSPSAGDTLDPFIQRDTTPSKAAFRAKAKGLAFKLPSLPSPRSALLDVVRQRQVSPLPSPLARDLRRRIEAMDIAPYEPCDVSQESCLGLDLGEAANSSTDIESVDGDVIVMQATLARSASAELVSSPSRSSVVQLPALSNSLARPQKLPRKIPLSFQSPFTTTPMPEPDHGAYIHTTCPDEVAPVRDGRLQNLRPSPSIGRYLSTGPRPSLAPKPLYSSLTPADLLHMQMQGAMKFPKYFPDGYLLEPNFARRYSLETELGAGGYGFVLSARHIRTNERVAVKFIDRRLVPTRGLIRNHENAIVPLEAVVLQLAVHPGVVQFYGLYDDGLYFYLVQELHGSPWSKNTKNKNKHDTEPDAGQHDARPPTWQAKPSSPYAPVHSSPLRPLAASSSLPSMPSHASPHGDMALGPRGSLPLPEVRPHMLRRASYDLFECIEQHERLSEGRAKYIFAQVVDTVWYLDSIGITHRDIKDENLVIDRDFKVKFIDFGSAVIRDVRKPPPKYTSFFGTLTFASPEILKGLSYTAPPAEVWTLGILLSFLVTGQSPFATTDHAMQGLVCELHESIGVSPACGDLMRKCLDPDPMRRYTIHQVREHPWLRGALGRA
ncbi:Serine/Threonine kinase catalytic domain containing protein [Ceratobasidium theobromae]|uniref:Serine/Threonine kinase catalytic domain containing protein n=1 Tax=Ceratobasidium theobromae TaxID=1582974 RepID=A0A5N5QY03_9AGAM|nr:Serine/Threonine kinase catalytic domain containing protein [Ceratobasidium theobromae]